MSLLLSSCLTNWLGKYGLTNEKVKVVLIIGFFVYILYQINITICMIMIGIWMVVLQNHSRTKGINQLLFLIQLLGYHQQSWWKKKEDPITLTLKRTKFWHLKNIMICTFLINVNLKNSRRKNEINSSSPVIYIKKYPQRKWRTSEWLSDNQPEDQISRAPLLPTITNVICRNNFSISIMTMDPIHNKRTPTVKELLFPTLLP